MRHAKSSWDDDDLKDYDRPLNSRGLKDAPRMGSYLKELNMVPDSIISSPAKRARQTVQKLSDKIGFNPERIMWNEALYHEGTNAYAEALRDLPGDVSTVLIAGHNPSVENLVSRLSGGTHRMRITTANIACFEVTAESWEKLEAQNCRFKWIVRPKDLDT